MSKPEVVYVIHCRTKDGRDFNQHVAATDAKEVSGKDGLKLMLKYHGKWITYAPGLWVSYGVDEDLTARLNR